MPEVFCVYAFFSENYIKSTLIAVQPHPLFAPWYKPNITAAADIISTCFKCVHVPLILCAASHLYPFPVFYRHMWYVEVWKCKPSFCAASFLTSIFPGCTPCLKKKIKKIQTNKKNPKNTTKQKTPNQNNYFFPCWGLNKTLKTSLLVYISSTFIEWVCSNLVGLLSNLTVNGIHLQ